MSKYHFYHLPPLTTGIVHFTMQLIMPNLNMSRMKIYSSLITLGVICTACSINEPKPSTIWNQISGTWVLDSLYTINGKAFNIKECESEIYWEIQEPVDIYADGEKYHSGVYEKWYGEHFTEAFCFYNPYSCQYSYYIPDMGGTYNGKICEIISLEYTNLTNNECPEELNSLSQIGPDELTAGCVTLRNFDPYKIKNIDSKNITFEGLYNIYGREVNGIQILDTVIIQLVRTGSSNVFTINDFTIDYYDIEYHENFENYNECDNESDYIKWGGIDMKCLDYNGDKTNCLLTYVSSITDLNEKGSPGYAISFWIHPKSGNLTEFLLTKYRNEYSPLKISRIANVISIYTNNGIEQTFNTNPCLINNEWNHIFLNVREDYFELFVNGKSELKSLVNITNYDNNSNWCIGSTEFHIINNLRMNDFAGKFDELIFYNDPFPSSVINVMYNYYLNIKYDPALILKATDYAGFNSTNEFNYSILQGDFENVSETNNGHITCASFNGTLNAYPFNINNNIKSSPNVTNYLSGWIRPLSTEKDSQIIYSCFSEETPTWKKYNLYVGMQKKDLNISYQSENGPKYLIIEDVFDEGSWTNLTLLFSRNSMKVFVDGVLLRILSIDFISSYIGGIGYSEMLGNCIMNLRNSQSNSSYSGQLDEFIFTSFDGENNTLTEKEIERIYYWQKSNSNFN